MNYKNNYKSSKYLVFLPLVSRRYGISPFLDFQLRSFLHNLIELCMGKKDYVVKLHEQGSARQIKIFV